MASDRQQELFSEIEQAQDELRESIEHSRRLVERSDALIRQVRDQPADLAGGASRATQGLTRRHSELVSGPSRPPAQRLDPGC
jgi:hypothetical protein